MKSKVTDIVGGIQHIHGYTEDNTTVSFDLNGADSMIIHDFNGVKTLTIRFKHDGEANVPLDNDKIIMID